MGSEPAPVRISHEAIYQAIYVLPRGALRTEIIALLRRGHAKRRPRARGVDRRGQIPHLTPIQMRPPEVAARLVPGHWEGDTLKGKFNRSAVGTLVERSTLFVLLARINGTTADGFSRVLDRVQAQHKLSLTYDRGREMTRHEVLTQRTGIKVYFADPHAPGSAASTRTPTACCVSTSPKVRTSANSPSRTSTASPGSSTPDPANHSAGNAPPNSFSPILIS